jgi:glyoxylase-like metal-dependent hydrolase (beta-lactamase superfamily II)
LCRRILDGASFSSPNERNAMLTKTSAFNRREIFAAGASLAALWTLGRPMPAMADGVAPGIITKTQGRQVVIHTYTAPEIGWQVNTHIIELPDQLIIVDAQYLLPCGLKVALYAKSLNKPITRIYVTHYHPDHHLGAAAFDAPLYALADVRTKINAIGERLAAEERAKFPAGSGMIADHARKVDELAQPGSETFEGVTLEFQPVEHAETEIALAVAIPADRVIVTQDLVYNRVHLFLGEQRFDGWRSALTDYEKRPFDRVLPGHGLPGGRELYAANIGYLNFAQSQLAVCKTGAELKSRLIQRYPSYGGLALLDHQNRFLFKSGT